MGFIEVVLDGCLEEVMLASDKIKVGGELQLDRFLDHFFQLRHDHTQHGPFFEGIRAARRLDGHLNGVGARSTGGDICEGNNACCYINLRRRRFGGKRARCFNDRVQQQSAGPRVTLLTNNCDLLSINRAQIKPKLE